MIYGLESTSPQPIGAMGGMVVHPFLSMDLLHQDKQPNGFVI